MMKQHGSSCELSNLLRRRHQLNSDHLHRACYDICWPASGPIHATGSWICWQFNGVNQMVCTCLQMPSSGLGSSASQSFVVTVNNPNRPPHLAPIGDKVAVVGQELQFTIHATDADQDPLTFSALGLPAGATLTPSSTYGDAVVTWTPTSSDLGQIDRRLQGRRQRQRQSRRRPQRPAVDQHRRPAEQPGARSCSRSPTRPSPSSRPSRSSSRPPTLTATPCSIRPPTCRPGPRSTRSPAS